MKKKVTRWEWNGNPVLLLVFCVSVVLLPLAVVHFATSLVKIESDEAVEAS